MEWEWRIKLRVVHLKCAIHMSRCGIWNCTYSSGPTLHYGRLPKIPLRGDIRAKNAAHVHATQKDHSSPSLICISHADAEDAIFLFNLAPFSHPTLLLQPPLALSLSLPRTLGVAVDHHG